MQAHEKIELIIMTCAEFYGVSWKAMMTRQGFGYMRANVYRLVKEHLPTSAPNEYLGISKASLKHCLQDYPEDGSYEILSFQIKSLNKQPA